MQSSTRHQDSNPTNISTTVEIASMSLKQDQQEQEDGMRPSNKSSFRTIIGGERIARVMTFLSLMLALFLALLDNTIISTSLPRIGSEFESMNIVSWVANSYLLTFDVFQPLLAKFSDIFGRKQILVIGTAIFILGSILCGVSQSIIMLIVCRAIQGIGAASIMSMVYVIISDLVPLEKRASYQGLLSVVFVIASVCGPLIGGGFTEYVTWRWNFYINIPIAGIALVALILFLHLPMENQNLMQKLKRVDYAGNILVLVAATLFLLAMNFGGQTFPWKSAAVIVPFVLTGIFIIAIVVVETNYAQEPLLPPKLFKNRTIISLFVANISLGLTFFAILYYLPVYFQVVRNDTAMWSGIRLIPMQVVLCVVSAVTGVLISKLAFYRSFVVAGTAFTTVSVGLFSLFDVETSWSMIYGCTVLAGAGLALIFPTTLIGLQAAADIKDVAVVTGLNNFTRALGAALGVAIASAALNATLQRTLPNEIPAEYAIYVFQSADYIRNGLPAEYMDHAIRAYMDSLKFMWYILIITAGLGFVSTIPMKHYDLRKVPKPQQDDKEECVALPLPQQTQEDRNANGKKNSVNHDISSTPVVVYDNEKPTQ